MPLHGTRQPRGSPLAKPLKRLTLWVVRFPVATLVIAGLTAAAAVALAAGRLEFSTRRSDLLSPTSDYHRRWLAYVDEFGDQEDVVVVVQGSAPDRVAAAADDALAAIARHDRLYHSVFHRIDLSRLQSKGLYYLEPSQLAGIERTLAGIEQTLASPAAVKPGLTSAGVLHSLPLREFDALAASMAAFSSQRLTADGGRLALVLLRLSPDDSGGFASNGEAIATLRRILGEVRSRHPHTRIGLTGLPVIEHDEMQSSQSSTNMATFLSLVGVVVVFVAGFGGIRHPMFAVAALLVGIAWSLGFIILGVGVDYGIHVVHDFLGRREHYQSIGGSTATALVINSLTTMVGFGSLMIASHQGLQSLGRVLTIGITCCLTSALVVSSLIVLATRRESQVVAWPTGGCDAPDGSCVLKPSGLFRPRRTRDNS